MKILLIGKNGQLGRELHRTLATLGEITALDYPEIDLVQPKRLCEIIRNVSPQVIINAAAYTDVDKAENESELAWRINAEAPGIIAKEAYQINAAFIHYSTDYVFDGKKGSPYIETDIPNPLNVYGKTKLEGEQIVQSIGGSFLILRTSWVYSLYQGGFVNKVLKWARQQHTLRIVDDQIGSPTWARMLAEATAQFIAQSRGNAVGYLAEKQGLYHIAGSGFVSRYEWAKAILELDPHKDEQIVKEIIPAKTIEFPTLAERALFSALENSKLCDLQIVLPNWKQAMQLLLNN